MELQSEIPIVNDSDKSDHEMDVLEMVSRNLSHQCNGLPLPSLVDVRPTLPTELTLTVVILPYFY